MSLPSLEEPVAGDVCPVCGEPRVIVDFCGVCEETRLAALALERDRPKDPEDEP